MSLDTGAHPCTMTDIENFITNEEATTIKDSILEDEPKIKKLGPDIYPGISGDSLTGRYSVYNWLTHERIGPILKPKLAKLFPNKWIQMWANVFRYNEGIEPHWHSLEDRVSGNLYIAGPENSTTCYLGIGHVPNKTGCLTYFPSNLVHWVVPNLSDIPRVSMAFDTIDFQKTHVHLQLKTQDD